MCQYSYILFYCKIRFIGKFRITVAHASISGTFCPVFVVLVSSVQMRRRPYPRKQSPKYSSVDFLFEELL